MTSRIPKADLGEAGETMAERFGVVPAPVELTWHSPQVTEAAMSFGAQVATWDAADDGLKTLAHMAVAAQVGCAWCLDFNYFQALDKDLDLAKASQVPRWRAAEDGVFTPLERDVLEYAEAMTSTPPTVTDALSARLLQALGAAALVELTAVIAFANLSTRSNVALGVEAQGFSSTCAIPLAS
jgi:alkylhydroperoxidase family enzyme